MFGLCCRRADARAFFERAMADMATQAASGSEYILLNPTLVKFSTEDSTVDVDENGRFIYVVLSNMDVRVATHDGSRDHLIR